MSDDKNLEKALAMSDSPEEGGKLLDIDNALGSSLKKKFGMYLGLAIAFFAVFVALLILCLGFRADYRPLKTAHDDRIAIINYAKNHNTYNLEGKVTGYKNDKETGMYSFTYHVEANGAELDAESPVIYTQEEINKNYAVNTTVRIAVKNLPFTQNTQSVNMDYADYDMMNYQPYKKAKVGFITFLVATSICFFIVCCFSGFAILSLKEMIKAKNDKSENVDIVKPNGKRVEK